MFKSFPPSPRLRADERLFIEAEIGNSAIRYWVLGLSKDTRANTKR